MEELQQYLQSIACVSFSHNLSNKGLKKMGKKREKNKEMSNLES
jgi:hypothetical protein